MGNKKFPIQEQKEVKIKQYIASYRAEKWEVLRETNAKEICGQSSRKGERYPEKERGMQKNCPRYLHRPLLESLPRTMSHIHRVKLHNIK